jgi:hypothetical protein
MREQNDLGPRSVRVLTKSSGNFSTRANSGATPIGALLQCILTPTRQTLFLAYRRDGENLDGSEE